MRCTQTADPDTFMINGRKLLYIHRVDDNTWQVHTIAGRFNGWKEDSLVVTRDNFGDAKLFAEDLINYLGGKDGD